MIDKINSYSEDIHSFTIINKTQLEDFRLKYLSKKGLLNDLFEEFKQLPGSERPKYGKLLNDLKNLAQDKFNQFQESFSTQSEGPANIDLSLPIQQIQGTRHPLTQAKNELVEIFSRLGFTIQESYEMEDDWHNFSALNFPTNHPARDMQDTFFINKNPDILLRTHTSSVQVRTMETNKPPIRSIMPGRVFRNEAISARAHCIFHQIEGLYIDKNVSFADLKQTLLHFSKEFFGKETEIRLRPSYFPFTEPSAEMDVSCKMCKGKGCNLCKYTGWLEVLGCGMVHPNVLKSCNIDPNEYKGFAFGMGIERIAMLKFEIKDLRLYFENDVRFLQQF
jgi:phenylalanyl-tRNA synthetase alpha chain